MYKTISINNNTYQQLHALAAKLQKPKSQVIEDLLRDYIDRLQEEEKNSLKSFNASVKRLSRKIKLPRGTKINIAELDISFDALRDDKS
jgi:hypothetical protein